MSDSKSSRNKIFVGGLSWDTSDAGFATFFSKFGEIRDAVVMRDKATGSSRGFGFISFAESSSLDKVLASKDNLELDGRKMEVKLAVPKEQMAAGGGVTRSKKVFVGGVPADVSERDFKDHFSQFGTITDAVLMMDASTGRSRGFGFVTFDSEDAADSVLARDHSLGGKKVECKHAIPQEQMRGASGGGGRGKPVARAGLSRYDLFPYADAYGFPPDFGYGPFRGAEAYGIPRDDYFGYGALAAYGYGAGAGYPAAAAAAGGARVPLGGRDAVRQDRSRASATPAARSSRSDRTYRPY